MNYRTLISLGPIHLRRQINEYQSRAGLRPVALKGRRRGLPSRNQLDREENNLLRKINLFLTMYGNKNSRTEYSATKHYIYAFCATRYAVPRNSPPETELIVLATPFRYLFGNGGNRQQTFRHTQASIAYISR